MRLARAATFAVAAALAGCAQMSAGDCSDKGTCDWTDAEPGSEAAVDASPFDADAPFDATLAPDADAMRDAMLSDGTVASDALPDRVDAASDVVTDAGLPSDSPDEADQALSGQTDASDAASEAGDSGVEPDACACVPAVPSGWSGPLALAESTGDPPPAIAPCVPPYGETAFVGNGDPNAPPAGCSCTCGAVSEGLCPAPMVALFADSACSIGCGSVAADAGACTNLSTGPCGASVYARARAPLPSGGSCTPQPTVSVTPMSWGRAARACALPTPATPSACGESFVCAPAPQAPFSGHLCAAITGDVPCPSSSPYSVKHVYYGGESDDRGCSLCTCGAPEGGSCGGSFTTYNATGCALETTAFPLSQTCNAVQIATASVRTAVGAPSGGSCVASLVQASGGVVPTEPTTVCCLP